MKKLEVKRNWRSAEKCAVFTSQFLDTAGVLACFMRPSWSWRYKQHFLNHYLARGEQFLCWGKADHSRDNAPCPFVLSLQEAGDVGAIVPVCAFAMTGITSDYLTECSISGLRQQVLFPSPSLFTLPLSPGMLSFTSVFPSQLCRPLRSQANIPRLQGVFSNPWRRTWWRISTSLMRATLCTCFKLWVSLL